MEKAVPLYHGGILAEILDKIGIELAYTYFEEALLILIDTEPMKKMAKHHTDNPGPHYGD